MEGPTFGGAYVRRKICVSKSIGLACSGKEVYHFYFVLLCILGQIPSKSPPGGLYSEGRFNGGFFCVTILGGLYLEGRFNGGFFCVTILGGLYLEGLISEFYGIKSNQFS